KLCSLTRILLSLSLSVLLCAPGYTLATEKQSQTFVLGAISGKPKKHIEHGTPMANYLASKLQRFGYTGGRVKVASDLDQMALWLRDGQVDLVTETVFSALALKERVGAELLARRWKKGVAQYASVFITKHDSHINALTDLTGKAIVFEDRGSSSGYFIPAAMLIEQGLELFEISSTSSPVPAGKVGILFANEQLNASSEINISVWVYQGQVAAGAYRDRDWKNSKAAPPKIKEGLRIFHQSTHFPRSLMVARASLPSEVKSALQEALFNAEQDEAGIAALKSYQQTKRFDALDSKSLRALKEGERLRRIVATQL
ncbi:MAG: phosphate/phosphite/phosphonate ABC transporter substrate-binding protein, partial [Oleiphilaceae bacterium]|nr:phosphate/phosphite/phosphonate ABC transporter substrate-binding protein [Oleiphilaceae bacterium]